MAIRVLTLDEYIDQRDRRPMGILGPIGPVQVCRIAIPVRSATARPTPPRRSWESASDARRRARLAMHRREAEDAQARARLERHRLDSEEASVVARLRSLR
jgi:hypothetical protein